jgi:stress response protein YsnF
MPDVTSDEVGIRSSAQLGEEKCIVVPVIEEQLDVRRELRTTNVVRVHKVVHEKESLVSEFLTSETVDIERVPKDLIVQDPPPVRTEGDVTVIPVIEEVLVVTKQFRLVEEVRITRRRSNNLYQQEVTLRSEQIEVEREAMATAQERIQKD